MRYRSTVPATSGTPDPADDALFWQDEILQAMFWMTKEGIEDRFDTEILTRFLDGPEDAIQDALGRLERKGYVDPEGQGYTFTDEGEHQAKRRFAQAFHELQGFDTSHTNCGPDCWCHDVDHTQDPCPSEHGHEHTHAA